MKTFNGYIWDFDGTLFDSYPRMSLAFCKAVRAYAQQNHCQIPISQPEVRRYMKQSVSCAWHEYQRRYQLPNTVLEQYTILEKTMEEEPFRPFSETPFVLRALKERGARQFIYTHRDRKVVDYLRDFGLLEYFEGIITAEDAYRFPPKPAPQAIVYLLQTYHLDPQKTIMIGDRSIDIEAAHRARIAGCLVDPEFEIAGCQAEYTIRSVASVAVE